MQYCGKCTLCCIFPKIDEMNSPRGEYCKECIPNVGCKIYIDRPESCRIFQCVWSQMKKVHIDLRPDHCGVMFEKVNDVLIVGSIDNLENISDLVNRQIEYFSSEGISVFVQQFNPYKFICYLVKGANKNEIIKALKDKVNDSTKLH